jgi:AraC family transcriptional activator of pobA
MKTNFNAPAPLETILMVPFEIYTLEGISRGKATLQMEKHMQSDFEVILIEEGTGLHKVNQCQYRLSDSKMYCVCPGQQHQLIVMPGTKGFVISFTEDFLMQADGEAGFRHHSYLRREFLQSPELTIEKEVAEDMQGVASLMFRERQKYSLIRAEILTRYLKIFMIYYRKELQKHTPFSVKRTSNSLVNDFFSELENNFSEYRTVGHYAKALYVTPNYLNHLIKTKTGFSARYHIQQRILLAAKNAVRDHSTMKEIAFHLGFNDMAHFSKFFKNVSGLNFSEFKKRMNEQYAFA